MGGDPLDSAELKELEDRQRKRDRELVQSIVEMIHKGSLNESVAKLLYPEIPWDVREVRGFIHPDLLERPWAVIPFYDKSIVAIYPFKESDFKLLYGLASEEILELWRRGRLYPLSVARFSQYSGEEYEHLHPFIGRGMPVVGRESLLIALPALEEYLALEREAESLSIFSEYLRVYAGLSILGFRERLIRGHEALLETEKRGVDISFWRSRWLLLLHNMFIRSPSLGSPTIVKEDILDRAFTPLGPSNKTSESLPAEVAGKLLENIELPGPADPEDVNIEIIIEAYEHAREFRETYKELLKRVNELQIRDAIDHVETLQRTAEELRKIGESMGLTAYNSLGVSTAALTPPALAALNRADLASLIPSINKPLREALQRGWLGSSLAKFLDMITRDPFTYIHTWKLHGVVKGR